MNVNAVEKMRHLQKTFRRTGIMMGLISGLTYGLYSTFVVVASKQEPLLSNANMVMAITFITCGINDFIAGLWLLLWNLRQGKLKEIGRSIRTFPGRMIILGALLGGPLANGAYLLGLTTAGAAAIPISATCAIFAAIFARAFLKQKLSIRVVTGMLICVTGAIVINLVKPEDLPHFTLGIIAALVAAISWGLEGTVSSFGGGLLDSDIAVNIRELISGSVILLLIIPMIKSTDLLFNTFQSISPMIWLILSGLSAAISFLTWYKANANVGAAVGMSLNITYVLWGVVLSVLFLDEKLTPLMLIGSIIIVLGAILVTVNPFELLQKGK